MAERELPEGIAGWPLGRPAGNPVPHMIPAERLTAAIAMSQPYTPHRDDPWPAEVASSNDSPAAAGDDRCMRCDSETAVQWYGELGRRQSLNLWRCNACGSEWSTHVRRASIDLGSED